MENVKIVGLGVAACVAYGIAHDMVTAHLCVEYFALEHPAIVPTDSAVVLALVWGVVATWWVGAILGLLLAAASRWGQYDKLTARDLLLSVVRLMALVGVCAFLAGVLGYWVSSVWEFHRYRFNPEWATAEQTPRYWAVTFAHTASYVVGVSGGIWLAVKAWLWRRRLGQHSETGS